MMNLNEKWEQMTIEECAEEMQKQKFKKMIEEIENGNVFYHCLCSSKYENFKDAIEYMKKIKQDKVCALSKDGGLLTGYVHYFNENGYLYSYVNDIKVNIYEN